MNEMDHKQDFAQLAGMKMTSFLRGGMKISRAKEQQQKFYSARR
jgi:hypothetical protein